MKLFKEIGFKIEIETYLKIAPFHCSLYYQKLLKGLFMAKRKSF